MAARNAGHAPQTCAHVQLAVERRSRGRKGEIPQPRHPGVALSQTRGRRGSERFRARQSTLRQSPHPAPAPVGRHGSLYGCRHSPAERKRAWGCPIVKTRRSAQPGLPEWHAERGSACRCERPALRAGERYTAACTNVRWQPPPAAGSLTERRWQPPAGRAGLCAVATACLQGRLCADLMRRLLAGALQRAGNRRPRGPACVPWQPQAGKAGLCADLMHRLLASGKRPAEPPCGAHRKLVSRRLPRTSATVLHGARTPGAGRARTPSGAGARTPTVARARTPSRARTSGADPQRRQSADPQWNWSADPHRSQSADPVSGADLRARTPSAGRARTPSGTGARTPTVARALTPSRARTRIGANARTPEKKPRAPPVGGLRGRSSSSRMFTRPALS